MPEGRGAEPFGHQRLVRAQLQLHAERTRLRTIPDAFEQGRTFGLLHVRPSELAERVRASGFPARLLLHARRRCSEELIPRLAALGYRVAPPLTLMTGAAAPVLAACLRIFRDGRLEDGLRFVPIGSHSPAALVRALQELQAASGVTALPGWYLRGLELPVSTVAVVEPHGACIGVGSIQCIGRAGGALSAMGLGICLSQKHRGSGLGTLLNSHLLTAGLTRFESERVHEIVEDPAGGSRRMNERCGLVADPEWHYLFGELREPRSDDDPSRRLR